MMKNIVPHIQKLALLLSTFLVFSLMIPRLSFAHAMAQSSVALAFGWEDVTAELKLPLDRLDIALKQKFAEQPETVLTQHGDMLKAYLLQHLRVTSPNGEDWQVTLKQLDVELGREQPIPTHHLNVNLTLRPPVGQPLERFTLHYSVICHQLVTHVAIVSIKQDWRRGINSSQPQVVGSIRYGVSSLTIDQSDGGLWYGFKNMLGLGFQHIAEGTDHIVFIVMLLLVAPMQVAQGHWQHRPSLKSSLAHICAIISAFTLGHSLTLIVGALGWVQLPAQPVEILIAFSILLTAVHALYPILGKAEILIAGGFGLVHGLAFSTLLNQFAPEPWSLALSILGFNLGIELVQLLVILAVVPCLLLLNRNASYTVIRVSGAILGIIAACTWLLERSFAIQTTFSAFLESLSSMTHYG